MVQLVTLVQRGQQDHKVPLGHRVQSVTQDRKAQLDLLALLDRKAQRAQLGLQDPQVPLDPLGHRDRLVHMVYKGLRE